MAGSNTAGIQVLILAAGRGSRLHPLTRVLPKVLLRPGRSTLLEYQIGALRRLGVRAEDITVIGGHGYEHLVRNTPSKAKAVRNTRYERWDNIYSITLGKVDLGPVLVVNGDGLYYPEIFVRTLRHPQQDFLVIDTTRELDRESMKVRYEGGRLTAVRKKIAPEDAGGEYIGLARFRGLTFRRVRQVAAEMVAAGQTDCWYESAIERVASEHPIGSLDIGGLPWVEVDDREDLRRAAAMASQYKEFEAHADTPSY